MYVALPFLPVTKLFIPALAGSRKVLMQPFTIQEFSCGRCTSSFRCRQEHGSFDRYWCNAFKVLAEEGVSNQKARTEQPTDFGCKLLSDDGWDPEDPASLWLLHWNLLSPPAMPLPGILRLITSVQLNSQWTTYLLLFVITEIACQSQPQILPEKDITCILWMYAEQDAKTGMPVRERGELGVPLGNSGPLG